MGDLQKIVLAWKQIYADTNDILLDDFLAYLADFKSKHVVKPQEPEWYKDAIVYSLYVDSFNKDFQGLTDKLDYISSLGVNSIWLLPILDSPMRDAGFDIRQYTKVRDELIGLNTDASDSEKLAVFNHFLNEAHQRDLRVIFDIPMNHTSDQHPWFMESRKGPDNPYRDFYIWNKDTNRYTDTRLLFKGMEDSNWKKDGDYYFFHRFFGFQPDLNYRNPQVISEMSKNLLFWLGQGVDGFRADAIPYLWKEEGTDCENLPLTHSIVKFFRVVVDYIRPHTLLLAEACQKPAEVVKYFGSSDECHAGYHFPIMPQIFKAIAKQSKKPIKKTLSKKVFSNIPENAQWFTFLRCHDELSLELVYVSEEDRAYIHNNFCHKSEWDFRLGEGISARLSELMKRNPNKIALAYSIMLTLPGTPVIYYGDEFGKLNDVDCYNEKTKKNDKNDSRFLVRGKIDWKQLENDLKDKNSFSNQVYKKISHQLRIRKKFKAFGRGSIYWLKAHNIDGKANDHILTYIRKWNSQRIMIIQNLSDKEQSFKLSRLSEISWIDLFGKDVQYSGLDQVLTMQPYKYFWVSL